VVVSNRRPFTIKRGPDGPVVERSAGGLVAAVYPLLESTGGTWIAWDGEDVARGREGVDSARTREPADQVSFCQFVPLQLSSREVQNYYYGFSNRALWPLCHLFIGRSHFNPDQFRDYVRVNEKFADATREVVSPNDRIWIHDYHLALVPELLRERSNKLGPVGLFWHIPFPPWDVFRALPWSRQILQGMLGADLVGFHLEEYADHFRRSVRKGLGLQQEGNDILTKDGRRVKVEGFPIGIDAEKIETLAASPPVHRRANQIRERLGAQLLVLAVDRLDYSKGIPERLRAVERFFERHPERRGKVVFVQVAVPSRTRVEEYRAIKRNIEEAVGRINGRFTEDGWVPIRYLYRSLPLNILIAHYRAADIALITPLRDGMNLVAMEYVASQVDGEGALILSELAGVAELLPEAFQVNPFDSDAVADMIEAALQEPIESRRRSMERMREQVREHDVFGWHERFWGALIPTPARPTQHRWFGAVEALRRK
jgi:alpha,alpha-trehalose-phosphate synthase [UDP-forming]